MAATILLVDDVQMMLKVEADFFKDTTADLFTANNGLEALRVIKEQKISLVFLDLTMPVMDGLTCCKLIKSDPNYRSLPVAIVTWSSEKDLCLASGCDYFLSKPVKRERFLEVARRVIPEINRRTTRISYSQPLILYRKSQRIHCSLFDISVGGAFIATDCPAQIKELVDVSFALPDGLQVECFGEVVWVTGKDSKRPQGIGIKFLALPRGAAVQLATFIDNSRAPLP